MIKVSAGTACVLGLTKLKTDAPPTTAYFMVGERCINNCSFCAQGRNSGAHENTLSRVTWPRFSAPDTFALLGSAYENGLFKRACLQVVQGSEALEQTQAMVKEIQKHSQVPICASAEVNSVDDVRALLNTGVDKVCIALDAITPELFQKVKGKEFHQRIQLLEDCGKAFPGRISTHLIVGLGETEAEMIRMIQRLAQLEIIIALFAFTPIKGTPLAHRPQPDIAHYRRIQIAHFLITKEKVKPQSFHFNNDRLVALDIPDKKWQDIITKTSGTAFRTTGCPDCNRPYYNESPQGNLYNYPRPLTTEEVTLAIKQSTLN